ncbi:MAG: GTP-binding protein [Erysipelotrichaceae bacterium]|nr:GTP-binding protein [Erysipelotrichaceae bacterium]
MIKVDVISGFLGAGKTTLIKKLFESQAYKNDKVVLIENEFGEIGIDGFFLKEAGVEIKEINSGCICCSLVGDFETSMKEVITKFEPTRIVIEPSGVGKLSDIIDAVKKVDADLQLNILATVVDAGKTKIYLKNFGEFFNNQVEAADTIVIAKVDKVKEDKLVEAVELIKGVNKDANIITTTISSFDGDKLVSYLEEKASLREKLIEEVEHEHHHHHKHEEGCCCGHHHEHEHKEDCCCHEEHHKHHHHEDEEHECCGHHHDEKHECCCNEEHHKHEEGCCEHHHHHHHEGEEHECCCGHHHEHHHHEGECSCGHHHHDADEVFVSWGIETPRSFTYEELDSFLKILCEEDSSLGMVLRSKGILKASDNEKWYYFDLVAGDYEIRLGEPDYTGRIVVIGSKLDTNKIENLFNKKA